jgi:hypothetical protein
VSEVDLLQLNGRLKSWLDELEQEIVPNILSLQTGNKV